MVDRVRARWVWGLVVGLAVVIVFLGWMLWAWPAWIVAWDIDPALRPLPDAEVAKAIRETRQALLWVAGGLIAIVTLVFTFFRDRTTRAALQHERDKEMQRRIETLDQRRVDAERQLRDRFVTLIGLLADRDAPTTRQASLYGLGALADDWDAFGRPDEVQVCIEAITAYLRAPLPDGAPTPPEEVSVRQAGYSIIRSHLQPGEHYWGGRTINLEGAKIDFSVMLNGAEIIDGGRLWFDGAKIIDGGRLWFEGAKIDGGEVRFDEATVSGTGGVWFVGATVSGGGSVWLDNATISGGGSVWLDHATVSDRGRVWLEEAKIIDGGRVSLGDATIIDGGRVSLGKATISGTGNVSLEEATISGNGDVWFLEAEIIDGGSVSLEKATISGGQVWLNPSTISGGGSVRLDRAEIIDGGSVRFDGATISDDTKVSLNDTKISKGGQLSLNDGTRIGDVGIVWPGEIWPEDELSPILWHPGATHSAS